MLSRSARCLTGIAPASDVDASCRVLSTFLGHAQPAHTYWYLQAVPELLELVAGTSRRRAGRGAMSLIAPTLAGVLHRPADHPEDASPRTIAAYRDTLRLLLRFAAEQTGKQPCRLDFADLDAPLIGAFLDHLEHERGNSARTRNARLAAIHSLYRYAALRHPEDIATIARVIEIPTKRHTRTTISYLDHDEIKALLRAPDRATWLGRRDHALLLTAIQTGLRVSELASLRIGDVSLEHRRALPRDRQRTQRTLRAADRRDRRGAAHLARRTPRPARRPAVPNPPRRTADPARRSPGCSTSTPPPPPPTARHFAAKRVTPHVLRHTNAMLLRASDVDILTIALWLGHESTKIHRDLPARRQQAQAASDRPHRPDRHATRQIPATRHAPRVPRRPLIIRSEPPPTPRQAGRTPP